MNFSDTIFASLNLTCNSSSALLFRLVQRPRPRISLLAELSRRSAHRALVDLIEQLKEMTHEGRLARIDMTDNDEIERGQSAAFRRLASDSSGSLLAIQSLLLA